MEETSTSPSRQSSSGCPGQAGLCPRRGGWTVKEGRRHISWRRKWPEWRPQNVESRKQDVSGLQDHPQVGGFARRTPRTQHMVVPTAVMYCSERHKAQSAKRKAHGVKSGGTRHRLQEPSPRGVTEDSLHSPCEVSSTRDTQ